MADKTSLMIWIKDNEMDRRIRANISIIKKSGFKLNGILPKILDRALTEFIEKNRKELEG